MKKLLTLSLLFMVALSVQAFYADIFLSWNNNPPAEFVQKYIVYQQKGTNFVSVVTATGTNTAKVRVSAPGTYVFKVGAVNEIGSGPISSNSVSVKVGTPVSIPTAPTGITTNKVVEVVE
jgi:hypothetical protein